MEQLRPEWKQPKRQGGGWLDSFFYSFFFNNFVNVKQNKPFSTAILVRVVLSTIVNQANLRLNLFDCVMHKDL